MTWHHSLMSVNKENINFLESQSGWLQTSHASCLPSLFLPDSSANTIRHIQPPQWGIMLLWWQRCFRKVLWGLVVSLYTDPPPRPGFFPNWFKMLQSEFNKVTDEVQRLMSLKMKRQSLAAEQWRLPWWIWLHWEPAAHIQKEATVNGFLQSRTTLK